MTEESKLTIDRGEVTHMTYTYLYRPDNGKVYVVIDLHEWRDSSRTTQGFSPSKVREFFERPGTEEERRAYREIWRLQSWAYDSMDKVLTDEKKFNIPEETLQKMAEAFKKCKAENPV